MSNDEDRGYATVSLEDIEPRQLDDIEPSLLSVGYELRPDEMRPNVWRFDKGEATHDHRHAEQEELYIVLDGGFDVQIGSSEGEESREEFELETEDFMIVSPQTWRQLTAREGSLLLVVGAPPVKQDDERRT